MSQACSVSLYCCCKQDRCPTASPVPPAGRSEKSLEKFCVSPDNEHIAFYGKDGTAILVSARTKQWAANLKMPGQLRSLCFAPSGDLLAGCDDGVVHRWDVRMRRSLWRFADEGSTCVTALACAPSGAVLATGCVVVPAARFPARCFGARSPIPCVHVGSFHAKFTSVIAVVTLTCAGLVFCRMACRSLLAGDVGVQRRLWRREHVQLG